MKTDVILIYVIKPIYNTKALNNYKHNNLKQNNKEKMN